MKNKVEITRQGAGKWDNERDKNMIMSSNEQTCQTAEDKNIREKLGTQ